MSPSSLRVAPVIAVFLAYTRLRLWPNLWIKVSTIGWLFEPIRR
jgi:hypothetical protein